MSIFSGIKNKLLKRREDDSDYQDIKSSVLEPPRPEGYEPYQPYQQNQPYQQEPPEPAFLRPAKSPREEALYDDRFRTPVQKKYEELTLNQGPYEQSQTYDVRDRLDIIEAQLSAIRSQTETINERLKNIEMRLPRRI